MKLRTIKKNSSMCDRYIDKVKKSIDQYIIDRRGNSLRCRVYIIKRYNDLIVKNYIPLDFIYSYIACMYYDNIEYINNFKIIQPHDMLIKGLLKKGYRPTTQKYMSKIASVVNPFHQPRLSSKHPDCESVNGVVVEIQRDKNKSTTIKTVKDYILDNNDNMHSIITTQLKPVKDMRLTYRTTQEGLGVRHPFYI